MKTITIDPRPQQLLAMEALLKQNAPIYGVEFTLPKLVHLLQANIDGQHTEGGTGKAAIEIATTMPLPPENATFAVVRADPDALGAIAILALRRKGELAPAVLERAKYVATQDSFQFGPWPGPRDPETLNQSERVLFSALTAICMDFKTSIESRLERLVQWLEAGRCEGLDEAIAKVKKDNDSSSHDAQIVVQEGSLVALRAHTFGATAIAYCYAPVAVIQNDAFSFPSVEGKHLKYTVCQYEADAYVNLPAVVEDLNAIETSGGNWGGSPAIIGSPQGVSSSLSMTEVLAAVKAHLK